jgi:CRP-like cAMP-binding protein
MPDSSEGGSAPIKEHPHYIADLQRNYTFFADMLEDEIFQFLRMCNRQTFEADETIFKEGDEADEFFLILSGEIVIEAGEKEFSRLKSGQIFGEMGILERVPRNATARAGEKSEVFSVARDVLAIKLPSLGFKIVSHIALQLSNKLRLADEELKKSPPPAANRRRAFPGAQIREIQPIPK